MIYRGCCGRSFATAPVLEREVMKFEKEKNLYLVHSSRFYHLYIVFYLSHFERSSKQFCKVGRHWKETMGRV